MLRYHWNFKGYDATGSNANLHLVIITEGGMGDALRKGRELIQARFEGHNSVVSENVKRFNDALPTVTTESQAIIWIGDGPIAWSKEYKE